MFKKTGRPPGQKIKPRSREELKAAAEVKKLQTLQQQQEDKAARLVAIQQELECLQGKRDQAEVTLKTTQPFTAKSKELAHKVVSIDIEIMKLRWEASQI